MAVVTNTWQTGYFPINSSKSFDNTASKYDPSAILTGLRFDEDKYNDYSRLYMPATLAIAYGMQFAALTAVFVHTFRSYPSCSLRPTRTHPPSSLVPPRHRPPLALLPP